MKQALGNTGLTRFSVCANKIGNVKKLLMFGTDQFTSSGGGRGNTAFEQRRFDSA